MNVHIKHVVTAHGIADAIVTTSTGGHRIGHHPADGWRCYTCDTRRCPAIKPVTDLIPDLGNEPRRMTTNTPRHVGNGANAENCPACDNNPNPAYPFTCPGEPTPQPRAPG